VVPLLGGLLFLDEYDREFKVVSPLGEEGGGGGVGKLQSRWSMV